MQVQQPLSFPPSVSEGPRQKLRFLIGSAKETLDADIVSRRHDYTDLELVFNAHIFHRSLRSRMPKIQLIEGCLFRAFSEPELSLPPSRVDLFSSATPPDGKCDVRGKEGEAGDQRFQHPFRGCWRAVDEQFVAHHE